MMRGSVFIKISLKYLWRYRRRYLFLFLAVGFGFAVLSAISSIKDGMKNNLYLSAQEHYAGDVIAMGYTQDSSVHNHLTSHEMNAIFSSAENAGLDPKSIAVRTTIIGRQRGTIYFNGNSVSLKYLVGVDWEKEADYFASLSYTESPLVTDDDSIFLSAPAAAELGALQGDSIILEALTRTGQKNTSAFIVAGITEDTNFFSYYKVFLSRASLNRLIGFDEGDCSLIGFFLSNRAEVETKRLSLYNELSAQTTTAPLVYNREEFDDEMDKVTGGISVFLLTLPVYLSEVSQLIDAIDAASYILYAILLAIIMVCAGVTCRLILHEREKEAGTMRVIGFYESDLRLIFKLEFFILSVLSIVSGFFISIAINNILSLTSFVWFPGFEVFMRNGSLNVLYLPETIGINVLLVFCMLALAVSGPVFRNSRNPLAKMLRGGAV